MGCYKCTINTNKHQGVSSLLKFYTYNIGLGKEKNWLPKQCV